MAKVADNADCARARNKGWSTSGASNLCAKVVVGKLSHTADYDESAADSRPENTCLPMMASLSPKNTENPSPARVAC